MNNKIFIYSAFFIIFILVAGFSVPAILMAYEVHKEEKAWLKDIRSLIPAKIETVEIVTNDFDFTFGGGGVCRGVSFKLSDRTLNDIRNQGISYFADAVPQKPATYRTKTDHWQEWRGTPVTPEDEEYSAPLIYGCTDKFKSFLERKGYKIGRNPTGYYTYVT